jgi:hypothetical protein
MNVLTTQLICVSSLLLLTLCLSACQADSSPTESAAVDVPGATRLDNAMASGRVDSVRFATGWARGEDASAVAHQAYQAAAEALDCDPKGVVFFCYFEKPGVELGPTETAPDLPREKAAARTIAQLAGQRPNIGARARPLVAGGTKLRNAVGVLMIGGAKAQCDDALIELVPDERYKPGVAIAEQLQEVDDLRLVFSLSEASLSFGAAEGTSVEDYIRAVMEHTPKNVVLFGGNNMGYKPEGSDRNVAGQYYRGKPLSEHIVAMGVGGPIRVIANHVNEFQASQQTVTVTDRRDKWVVSFNDQPAAEVYRRLRGMEPGEPFTRDWQHPVGVVVAPDKVYLRMILDWVDEQGKNAAGEQTDLPPGSLRFVSPIVEGTKVRILKGGDDARAIVASAADGFAQSLREARSIGAQPLLALTANCCARGMRLRTFRQGNDDEVPEAIMPILGNQVPLFGFYAYGELGPIRGPYQGLDHQYQQHTFVSALLALDEDEQNAQ